MITWQESLTPLAEIGRSDGSAQYLFPYDAVFTILDIRPVTHLIEMWESVDGIAKTNLITLWHQDASKFNEISALTFQYLVDRGWNNTTPVSTGPEVWADPVNLDTELVDERLADATKEELTVHEAGYGNKLNAEYDLLAGGGIVLLNGKTFDTDVAWFITYNQTVATQVSDPDVVAEQTGVEVLTANKAFFTSAGDNMYNKLVIANGSGNILQVTFPAMASIPSGTRVTFNTHRGVQKYLSLLLNGSETIYLNGTLRNKIYLAQGEEIKLFFDTGVGYVLNYSGNDKIRGQVVGDYQVRAGSFLLADTSTGVLQGTDYPGLYEWLQSLPPGATVSHAVWLGGDNRKWALETIPGTFRVPHLADVHVRFRATTEAPGTYHADNMPQHDHFIFGNIDDNAAGIYPANFHSTGGNLGYAIFGSNAIPSLYRTGPAYVNGQQQVSGIFENRVKAFRQIPLIVL